MSFPDLKKTPTLQGLAPPCKNTPIPGLPEVPGAVDPATTVCLTPPRPVIWCKSSDGTPKNQTCQDQGPLTLERSKTVDEEISAKVIDFLDHNDPKKTGKPFFVWYNPARMHVTTVLSDKYMAMVGESGGKDWGVNEAGMKQMDDNAIAPETATGFLLPGVQTQFAASVVNLKRDPFEIGWGDERKANFWFSGALAGPVTAYIYDWNMLPIGQALWLKELESYKKFPPMQDPASYNLDQVMEQLRKMPSHPSQ